MIQKHRAAARQLDDCLGQICQHHGYEQFLIRPTVEELKNAATDGLIVVVNLMDISTHDIIISESDINQSTSLNCARSSAADPARPRKV